MGVWAVLHGILTPNYFGFFFFSFVSYGFIFLTSEGGCHSTVFTHNTFVPIHSFSFIVLFYSPYFVLPIHLLCLYSYLFFHIFVAYSAFSYIHHVFLAVSI